MKRLEISPDGPGFVTKRKVALLALLVVVVAPLYFLSRIDAGLRSSRVRQPAVGAVFPELAIDAGSQWPGSSLALPSGRRRVVVFARVGCQACERTLDTLGRLSKEDDHAMALLAVVLNPSEVNLGDTYRGVPSIADADGSLAERFGAHRVPLTFVLDGSSRVATVVEGERSEAAWLDLLAPGVEGV